MSFRRIVDVEESGDEGGNENFLCSSSNEANDQPSRKYDWICDRHCGGKNMIRIAYFVPTFTQQARISFHNFVRKLGRNNFYSEMLYPSDIRDGKLFTESFSAIFFPGGHCRKQAISLGIEGKNEIERFVRKGGGYVGCCAGAYLVCTPNSDLYWSFGLIDIEVDYKNWRKTGKGNCVIEFTDEGNQSILRERKGESRKREVLFSHGPVFEKIGEGVVTLASFSRPFGVKVRKKDDIYSKLDGKPAIVASDYFQGRVMVSSPHIEKMGMNESYILRNVFRWVCKRKTRGLKRSD